VTSGSGIDPAPTEDKDRDAWWHGLSAMATRKRSVLIPQVALLALVLYFGWRAPTFLSMASADNLMRQMAFLTVLALAGTFVILIGGIDLSVAANATLAGILVATWVDSLGGPLAITLALLVGAAVGLVNGIVTTFLRVPSFLVTLGMLSILDGISNTISQGGPVSFRSNFLNTLINRSWIPKIPNGALITLILVLILTVVAFLTTYGRHLYAVGGNERAARLAGIRVRTVKLSVFSMSGLIAAIAGIILTGQASTGVPLGADASLLNSIAAIVVGGTALSGGVGGPHRTLLGTFVIVVLGSGMDITGVDPYTQLVVKGVVVIAAVALTIDRRRYGLIK
jgi:ribose transport system permease protein